MPVQKIYLPTRPQPDTVVAVFLLRTYGATQFPGVQDAMVETHHEVPESETFESLLEKGILCIDVGRGPFDHHGGSKCASELVAEYLKLSSDPSIGQLLRYAKRDDAEGKGTLSADPLDRAFGLSGLIASLNKKFIDSPQSVIDAVLPLLEAHHFSSKEHHTELPNDIDRKKKNGEYHELLTRQNGKNVKIVFVISDKPSMPGYLRSYKGARADVVVQKSEQTNHMCVLTKQDRKIDLSKAIALLRLHEAELGGKVVSGDLGYLEQVGRIEEVPHWYYDPATNSLLNGGSHNRLVAEPLTTWENMQKIIRAGIELGGKSKNETEDATYFLSMPLPEEHARQILSNIEADGNVKVHEPKNLHVTLEYLGRKSLEEIKTITEGIDQALQEQKNFTLTIRDSHFSVGSPEGYDHAWYLSLEDGSPEIEQIHELRSKALSAAGIPEREKSFHITLASKRNSRDSVPDSAVQPAAPFEIAVPIDQIALMESKSVNGRKEYRPYKTYILTE